MNYDCQEIIQSYSVLTSMEYTKKMQNIEGLTQLIVFLPKSSESFLMNFKHLHFFS